MPGARYIVFFVGAAKQYNKNELVLLYGSYAMCNIVGALLLFDKTQTIQRIMGWRQEYVTKDKF